MNWRRVLLSRFVVVPLVLAIAIGAWMLVSKYAKSSDVQKIKDRLSSRTDKRVFIKADEGHAMGLAKRLFRKIIERGAFGGNPKLAASEDVQQPGSEQRALVDYCCRD